MMMEVVAATLFAALASALAIARRGLRRRDEAITAYRTQLVVSQRYLREIKAALASDGGVARHIAHTRQIARDLGRFGSGFLDRAPDTARRLVETDRYLQALGATVGLPTQAVMATQDESFERTYAPLSRYIAPDTR